MSPGEPTKIAVPSCNTWRTDPLDIFIADSNTGEMTAVRAPPGLTAMVVGDAIPDHAAMATYAQQVLPTHKYLPLPPGLDHEWCPTVAALSLLPYKEIDDRGDCASTVCGGSVLFEDDSIASSLEEAETITDQSLSALDILSFAERAQFILSALSESAQRMGLSTSGKSISQLLHHIAEHPSSPKHNSVPESVNDTEMQHLETALRCLGWQELITKLNAGALPPSVKIAAQTLACEMQLEIAKLMPRNQRLKKEHRSRGRQRLNRRRFKSEVIAATK
jgi:hypothetical protein